MTTQERIYLTAKENIGETVWAKKVARTAKKNSKVKFGKGEYKCNLFVYEVLLCAGIDIGLTKKSHPSFFWKSNDRPACASDWYDEDVCPALYKKKIDSGDVATDGKHMGIVYYNNGVWGTINAGEFKVNFTPFKDWCPKNMKYFRLW